MVETFKYTLPYLYEARDYQKEFWLKAASGCKRFCLVWHRRAGKEKTCWNYMVMKAAMEPGIYYYFFPHFSQGRKILWDGMDKSGFRFLDHIPQKLLVVAPNSTEMKIKIYSQDSKVKTVTEFQDDGEIELESISQTTRPYSIIQIIGTNNIDSIVGTNPRGCVFSEYSLQDPKAWQLIRPILTENQGWAIFNFCVSPDTLCITQNGMEQIGEIIPNSNVGFTELNLNVYGLNGFSNAELFYNGGMKKTLKITTSKGYFLECTPNHPILSMKGWKNTQEWNIGDIIPIQRNQQIFSEKGLDISGWEKPGSKDKRGNYKSLPDDFLTLDFFYLMGLVLAEGNIQTPKKGKGATVTIANNDPEIHDFLLKMGFQEYRKGTHFTYCGNELISFLEWFGLKKLANKKEIPLKLLKCRKNEIIEFLKGYFDGDGCATKRGNVHCDSSSKKLIDTLQIVLLNFGVISKKYTTFTRPTKRVKISCICHRLELTKNGSFNFFREIGFRLTRKQSRQPINFDGDSDQIPINKSWFEDYRKGLNISEMCGQKSISYRKAKELLNRKKDLWLQEVIETNYFYDKVISIETGVSPVYDFTIPITHSFFSNGFISHNTPRGQNWSKDLYDMALTNPDWFCQLLTVKDTGVISEKDIDAERAAGMSEDYVQQEFYCSFTLGIEGSYYGWYLQKAESENRITNVPWAASSPVHIAMDLGYGDATSIIWYQLVGKEIHIIDFYENQGQPFSHYAKVIKEKPYIYGRYYAPSDAASGTLSTGLSIQEVASSFGISLTILPTVTIPIESGIEAARSLFASIWFDAKKCTRLIKCLENYQKIKDEKHDVYREKPLHNWASHSADAFRYVALAVKMYGKGESEIDDAEYQKMRNKYLPRFEK